MPFLASLKWLGGQMTLSRIGANIGVSQSTISRYLGGIVNIPFHRQHAIALLFEQTQYRLARSIGYSVRGASIIRGLRPGVFDFRLDRADQTIRYWAEGRLSQMIKAEGIDVTTVDLDALYDDMLARVRAEIRDSDISGTDLEKGDSP